MGADLGEGFFFWNLEPQKRQKYLDTPQTSGIAYTVAVAVKKSPKSLKKSHHRPFFGGGANKSLNVIGGHDPKCLPLDSPVSLIRMDLSPFYEGGSMIPVDLSANSEV